MREYLTLMGVLILLGVLLGLFASNLVDSKEERVVKVDSKGYVTQDTLVTRKYTSTVDTIFIHIIIDTCEN